MLTVTSKLQYDQARKEANVLTLEQTLNARHMDRLTASLTSLTELYGDDTEGLKDDANYQSLMAENTALDLRNDSIATELELLQEDMNSFQALEKKSIQSSTQFWCFGG